MTSGFSQTATRSARETLNSILYSGVANMEVAGGAGAVEEDLPDEAEQLAMVKPLLIEVSAVYLLISAYFAMILTNWGTDSVGKGSSHSDDRLGTVTMWLQAAAQWVVVLLYVFSLFVPRLFPDREFRPLSES